MKRSIQTFLVFALVMVFSANTFAQGKMSEERKKEMKAKFEVYKQKLNLNEEQSKKVDTINAAYFDGLTTLKNSVESKMEKYKKLKSLNSDRNKQMKSVLTKEQFKIYKEQQQEMKEEFKARRANRE